MSTIFNPSHDPMFQDNEVHPNAYTIPIKARKAYACGKRVFRTPQAAAKYQAWRLILSKYANWENIEKVQHASGMDCECCDDPTAHDRPDEGCPLHNRYDGYFKRLGKRLARLILKQNGYTENWRDTK